MVADFESHLGEGRLQVRHSPLCFVVKYANSYTTYLRSHEMFEALVAALNKSQARPEHEARRIRIISALTRFLSQWNTSITTPIPDVKQLRWLRQHLFDVYTYDSFFVAG